MDGVGDLEAYQFIAQVIGAGVGIFFAVCFILGIMAGPDKIKPSTIIPEQIELGYISDSKPKKSVSSLQEVEYDELKDLQRQVKIRKLKQQLKEMDSPKPQRARKKPEHKETNSIVIDCIDAMIAMGEKKSVARATVNKYFVNNPNTKSVEDFLAGVFKK